MTDQTSRASSALKREAWLLELRRENERQEDASPTDGDAYWEDTDDTHTAFVDRFLAMLPTTGSVLDAACGIGRYVGTTLATGRSVLAVDASAGHLAAVRANYPGAATEKHDLQDMPYRDRFDGVLCVDAMEFVPPEDWPRVLERFRDALHRPGWLYLTVELVPADQIRALNRAAREAGQPVVDGEVLWDTSEDSPGYYHYYPSLEQVHSWLGAAGFAIVDEREGPWHDDEYAYHHMLAQTW